MTILEKIVDQLAVDGTVFHAPDKKLEGPEKLQLFLDQLPGASLEEIRLDNGSSQKYLRFQGHAILFKQITHLGKPWPSFKKRIQIPPRWSEAYDDISSLGLKIHFMGVYKCQDVVLFADFAPQTYIQRKVNNSAAHLSTNDLYQALVNGVFSKVDRNLNQVATIRQDLLHTYITSEIANPDERYFEIFRRFNLEMLDGTKLYGPDVFREMYDADARHAMQTEWPGFYLEHRIQIFLEQRALAPVQFQQDKTRGSLDFDLIFMNNHEIEFLGDLKASNSGKAEAPGNDLGSLKSAIEKYGRFWYIIYEHETWLSKDYNNTATREWNQIKQSLGYFTKKKRPYNELSYASKYKDSVRFYKMMILELNKSNFDIVLSDFKQGKQPDGSKRALKAMINKKRVDAFCVFRDGDLSYSQSQTR